MRIKFMAMVMFWCLIECIPSNVYGVPAQPYTLFGTVTVDGVALKQTDTNFTVTLKVNGVVLVSYRMGENPAAGDNYVLIVPMDTDVTVSNAAFPGNSADIYINDVSANENPVTIGNSGETLSLDIHANLAIPAPTVTAPPPKPPAQSTAS